MRPVLDPARPNYDLGGARRSCVRQSDDGHTCRLNPFFDWFRADLIRLNSTQSYRVPFLFDSFV
jgi:hypothetical protein